MDQENRPDQPANVQREPTWRELLFRLGSWLTTNAAEWKEARQKIEIAEEYRAGMEAERLRIQQAAEDDHTRKKNLARKKGAADFRKCASSDDAKKRMSQAEKESLILAKLRELGHDPLNLPGFQNGSYDPVRADVAALVSLSGIALGKAWRQMVKAGAIKYAKPDA